MNPFEHYYDPGDMSMCVGTETTAGEINARGHGDGLLFPLYLDPDMPIAQLVEQYEWTPASFRFGPLSDNVLGMNFELAGGKIVKIGARVVKNVTGFEYTRFFCRSGLSFGRIRDVVLRLRPLEDRTLHRLLTGDRDAAQNMIAALTRHRWAPVISSLDFCLAGDNLTLQMSFTCAADRIALYDRHLGDAVGEHGYELTEGEPVLPIIGPFVRAKTTISKCLPTAEQLVGTWGGTAYGFLGNGYFHYEPPAGVGGQPEFKDAVQALHETLGAEGGHVDCERIVYPQDSLDKQWEASLTHHFTTVP